MKIIRLMVAAAGAMLLGAGAMPASADEEQLGKVNFANSCSPAVQAEFERGVAMLHSFWYNAAEKTFRDVIAKDPGCAIAGWGIASILMNNPLAGTGASAKGAVAAQAAIDQARSAGAKTQRERDYIEAVAEYYRDFANRPERERQLSRAKAYEALAAKYPNDDEAQIFAALYLAGTQLQSDQTYAAYRKAAAVLEKEFVKYPDHPGVAHYLIHSYDAPPIAQQGLPAARRYAGIAPAAPHALHMPSHIFTRVGAWDDSAATNLRSMDAAVKGGQPNEAYHASDYAVYAYLQLGRDEDAKQVIENVFKVRYDPAGRAPYGVAAMPARYAIERGAWREAMQLQVAPNEAPYVEALTYFSRALGAARSGDIAEAEKGAAELARLNKKLRDAGDKYWATEVEVQQFAIDGWIALAQGKREDALKSMRTAADMEDRNEKHITTPGRIVPARELLGDMLMEVKQPALALKEYEASQLREPNRFRGIYGAALAAEQSGDKQKAATYYRQLADLAKNADSPRPELTRARAYVAER